MIRCKFRCDSIDRNHPDMPEHRVRLSAIQSKEVPEDLGFTKFTPCGTLEATISNPAALAQLSVGGYYYLDLSPVPEAAATVPPQYRG
jgi:hypothetical protein